MASYGIDVSSNNPHPINWTAAYNYLRSLGGGKPFVFVKINQGVDYLNPYAQGDIQAARSAGFAVGGYNMTVGTEDATGQQNFYRSAVAGLPEGFDVELPNGASTSQYVAQTAQFVAQNHSGLVYLNQAEVAEGFPTGAGLWLAQYNKSPGNTTYPCVIHQYDNAGVIPGCAGIFDLNIWTESESFFNTFFEASPAPTPTPTPTPTKESSMAITPIITNFTPGTKHLFQVHQGTLYHKYEADSNGKWGNEILAGPSGNGVALKIGITVPDQVPQYVVVNNQILVTIEDSRGFVFMFAQNVGAAAWGVNQLP